MQRAKSCSERAGARTREYPVSRSMDPTQARPAGPNRLVNPPKLFPGNDLSLRTEGLLEVRS